VAKSIMLGNGYILVGLDKFGQVKDFYFHYPGLENHVSENLTHKIGMFLDNRFTWIDEASWSVEVGSIKGTMASDMVARNSELGIELHFNDVVYNEKDIFIREIKIKNLFDRLRTIKLFFNQQFNISQTSRGETAYYDPRERVIIHYKGRRVFLVNATLDNMGFDEYSTGLMGIEGKTGTFKDAEDGKLSGNGIEHGKVDSVIGISFEVQPKKEKTMYYWVCVAKSIASVKKLDAYVRARLPQDILKTTKDYWSAWANVRNFSFYGLKDESVELFKQSLFNMRTHTAKNGAIIASGDSEMLQFGRDYYEYVWPRDGANTAIALASAGDYAASRRFFKYCEDIITDEGYFMHKYHPDKSLGASWHPWVENGRKQFPIQEDETALVVYALWEYYRYSRDLEFVETIYNSIIRKAGEFMLSYKDSKTSLPGESYDLWEREYGISTFTSSSVYGALIASANFAKLLGKQASVEKYFDAAETIKKSIFKYLYDKEAGVFYKLIDTTAKRPEIERTVDISSIYGIYKFGVLKPEDTIVKKAVENTIERLSVKTDSGGIARFEGDTYHHMGGNYPGNPWIITSLWLAQYYIAIASSEASFEPAKDWINWVTKYANKAGVLPEQLNPYNGEHLSAAPLTWSHAEYVLTITQYLGKLEELGICKACYPVE